MATKAKAAAKAAPAPAQEAAGFEVGQSIKFVAYGADVPEAEQVLVAEEVYVIVDLAEETGNPIVEIENPDFNPKKKEHAETNPKLVQVEVFPEECEAVEDEAGEAEAEAAPAAEAPAQKAPAKKTAAKPAAKAAPAAAEKPAAKSAAKKTTAKAAPAPEPEATEEQGEETDELSVELEGEDEEIVALVEGSDDLISTAQELEAGIGHTEWQLGGLLYHIRKDKKYLEVDGAEAAGYAENRGFETFLRDFFNVEYRKAMYLIQIYVRFTQAQIENPADVVGRLGWTKAQKIAVPMAAEDANVEELIELAAENTVADLSVALKEQVQVGGTPGTKGETKKRLTLKFRFFEEEAATVNTILAQAAEELGVKDIGDALLHILSEYQANNAGGAATQEAAPTQAAGAGKPAAKAAPKPARKTAARAAA